MIKTALQPPTTVYLTIITAASRSQTEIVEKSTSTKRKHGHCWKIKINHVKISHKGDLSRSSAWLSRPGKINKYTSRYS